MSSGCPWSARNGTERSHLKLISCYIFIVSLSPLLDSKSIPSYDAFLIQSGGKTPFKLIGPIRRRSFSAGLTPSFAFNSTQIHFTSNPSNGVEPHYDVRSISLRKLEIDAQNFILEKTFRPFLNSISTDWPVLAQVLTNPNVLLDFMKTTHRFPPTPQMASSILNLFARAEKLPQLFEAAGRADFFWRENPSSLHLHFLGQSHSAYLFNLI